jgi:glycosyltransferase involved in cell wall biosynthesis
MIKSKGILLLTDIFHGMGGSERNITQLLEGIDKNKFKLYVARFASAHLPEGMKDKDVVIMNLNGAGIYTISGLRNLVFLKRFVREKEISLILTYHESSDFYGLALSFICNIPVISSRRDMSFKTKPHHRLAYRLGGKYFDSAIAVSNAVREEVIRRSWFREGRTFTIYNGINTANYGSTQDGVSLKKKLGIHPKYPVVGMVANIRRIKGYRYFLEASSIIHRYNRNVQFLVVGNDWTEPGFTITELKRYGEKMGVSQNLHFLGEREDVADLVSLFDVAVLASLSEGFSNVILEYMASSKPVVATQVGGNPEIVVHGETGLLVPPADAQALADAILSILEDEEAASRYGTAGKKRVEDKFGLGRMIRQYEDLFERVMSTELAKSIPC